MYKCTYTHRDGDNNLIEQGELITDAEFKQIEPGLQLYYTEHTGEDFSKYMWQAPVEMVDKFDQSQEAEEHESFIEEFNRQQEEMSNNFSAPFNEF